MNVLGFRSVVSKKDGVHYVELYLLYDTPPQGVVGDCCEVVFLREDMIEGVESLAPGVACDVMWSKFGRGRVEKVFIR